MTVDVDRFRQSFITESLELLQDMEDRLLALGGGTDDLEEINAIFRCAHSIKGGSGVFGLHHITAFTHCLEALLDRMREGKIPVNLAAVNLLLEARDIVLQMIVATRDGVTLPEGLGKETEQALQQLCDGGMLHRPEADLPAAHIEQAPANDANDGAEGRYQIHFAPHRDLFATGNEPLLLFRALRKLGQAQIRCDASRLPAFEELAPRECHLSWDIELLTDQGLEAIREVFEFVEDECDLTITHQCEAAEEVAVVETAAAAEASPVVAAPATSAAAEKAPAGEKNAAQAATSIRVDIEKVDRLINMVGEIVITQTMLAAQTRSLPVDQYTELLRGIDELAQHTRELQEAVMMMRMQPVKSIFSRMPRLVRDIAAKLDKNIRLEMIGENTEVDKTVIEQLADPLTHMIRNSADHGIEKPETRLEAGKPEQGTIRLEAAHRSGRIVIEVGDDGGGINRVRVLEKAKSKGIIPADAVLSDEEIDRLIFAPGFSTAEVLSDISGRGVGMDVVKRNIESIGGTVSIHNQPGRGSTFRISLPLTLAILDAMIVMVGQEYYIIPINNIIETTRPKAGEVRRLANGSDVVNIRGEFIPLTYLHEIFHIYGAATDPSKALIVLVESGQGVSGLVVDELIGQQQVVIKSLETNLDPVRGISGATILGDGRVALILDIAALSQMRQAEHHHALQLAS